MLLAVDVGNTNTKISLMQNYSTVETLILANIDNPKIKKTFLSRIFQKKSHALEDYYSRKITDLLERNDAIEKVEGSIISSVVPNISAPLIEAIKTSTNTTPITFKDNEFNFGVKLPEEVKGTIGEDLVAIGYGAYLISNIISKDVFCINQKQELVWTDNDNTQGNTSEENSPVIVICSGTATTMSIIDKDGKLNVASIATGITKSTNALFSGAALLKSFDINNTEPKINNTFGCIVNGQAVIQALGHKAFADKMNKEYLGDNQQTIKIITGGAAPLFAKYINDKEPMQNLKDRNAWYHISNLIPIGLVVL